MRVVVTGIGIVSLIGTGIDQFWNAAVEGRSGINRIECFDASGQHSQIADEISGFNPASFLSAKQVEQTDRFTQLALYAANLALEDTGALEAYASRDPAWADLQHLNRLPPGATKHGLKGAHLTRLHRHHHDVAYRHDPFDHQSRRSGSGLRSRLYAQSRAPEKNTNRPMQCIWVWRQQCQYCFYNSLNIGAIGYGYRRYRSESAGIYRLKG